MIASKIKIVDFAGALARAPRMELRVKRMVTLAVREDTNPYVPYQDGALRRSAEVSSIPDKGKLVYDTPYARAQYYGLPGKTWPGTCMQWFVKSRAAHEQKWFKIAEEEAWRA